MTEYRAESPSLKAYQLYIAFKLHFTTEQYDIFYYEGRTKVTSKTYSPHEQIYFTKLARHYRPSGLLLANMLQNPNKWIGDIVSNEGEDIFIQHQSVLQSLWHVFDKDIKKISLSDLMPTNSSLPGIYQKTISHKISYETMIILIDLFELYQDWEKILKNHFLWEKINFKIRKYTPFLEYDKKKYSEICKKHFTNELCSDNIL